VASVQSIKIHENGKTHQEAVRNYLKDQKKAKVDQASKAAKLSDTLATIEAAARAAVAHDVASGAFSGSATAPMLSSSDVFSSAPVLASTMNSRAIGASMPPGYVPPQPSAPAKWAPKPHGKSAVDPHAEFAATFIPPPPPPPPSPPPDDDDDDATGESGQSADAHQTVAGLPEALAVSPSVIPPPRAPKLHTTESSDGLGSYGAWETVSVREVAENADIVEDLKAPKAPTVAQQKFMQKRAREEAKEEARLVVQQEAADAGMEDAYSLFNPYGGKYRGFDLRDASDDAVVYASPAKRARGEIAETIASASAPEPETLMAVPPARVTVEFKKRGLKPGQQIRRRGADDD
jgi:hypothetical protein